MFFRNKFWFLSNMYPCSIVVEGIEFKCAEAAFQAYKCKSKAERIHFTKLDGFEAKRLGRKIDLRSDWYSIRDDAMFCVVLSKFRQHPELMRRLKNIRGIIKEENTWNDTYWGVCNNKGRNKLGEILMYIRERY